MLRVLAVVVLCLALPSTAAAGTVAKAGTTITWEGDAEADIVTISSDAGTARFAESGIVAGTDCMQVDVDTATCPVAVGDTIVAAAGDMGDTVTCLVSACTLDGGAGDDTLVGGAGDQTFVGGAGPDTMTGSAGDTADYSDRSEALTLDADGVADDGGAGEGDNIGSGIDRIVGGSGPDTFLDALGPQTYAGGDGSDTASYANASDGVTLSLDGVANDGPESDDIEADVENLIGGAGADMLTGSAAPNGLEGGGGDDSIDGAAEADDLVGGDGTDELGGGEGADRLDGGPGDEDELVGGPGPDVLSGGAGVRDEASYAERTARVEAVLGGGPVSGGEIDGPVSARDVVGSDVERLVGGSGPDRLTDTGGPHGLEGGPGDDTIVSRDGDPGIDFVGCGDGTDTAVIDPNDGVQDNCENVDRGLVQPPPPSPPDTPPPPPPPPPPGNPPPTTPGGPTTVAVAAVRGQTLVGFLRRGLRVRVTCPRACRATLRIRVSQRTARRRRLDSPVIASGFARLARRGRVTAVVEPRPGVRRRLRTARRLQVTVEARVTPTGQRTRVHRFELTLRRGTAS